MKFQVQITETLQRLVVIDTKTPEDAERIVRRQYDCGKVVLDSSDFVGADFETISTQVDVNA